MEDDTLATKTTTKSSNTTVKKAAAKSTVKPTAKPAAKKAAVELAQKPAATKLVASRTVSTKSAGKKLVEKKKSERKLEVKKSEPTKPLKSTKKPSSKPSSKKKKEADWYDYPQYFDLGFADETAKEVAFLPLAFERFGTGEMKRILEPGCGSGRLVVSLAEKGYDVTGFDLSDSMLAFLNKQLAKKKLTATTYKQDMTDFEVDKPFDVVLNTFNTFRHLLTEEAAESHFHAVARALRPGGLFFFGLHLYPHYADERCIERWTSKTGGTSVTFTLRATEWDKRKRIETLRISMLIRKPKQEPTRVQSEIQLRTYRLAQLQSLLAKVPELELVESYDFWYEIDEPIKLTRDSSDSLLVFVRK